MTAAHRAVFFLVLSLASTTAQAICWVQKVVDVGGTIRLVMNPRYEWAARKASHPDKTPVQRNGDGTFDLQEGDHIFFMTMPHDSCTGEVKKRDGKLGLELKSSMCDEVSYCYSTTAFMLSE